MQYVVGVLIMGLVWLLFYWYRPDLRKDMIWSGKYYFVILSVGFILIRIIAPNLPTKQTIVPGYWNPDSLFNLARITGDYAIEDAIYMFFSGGIAAAVYEIFFRKKLGRKHLKYKPHYALLAGTLVGAYVGHKGLNLIYVLIVFGFVSAMVIWAQRRDLFLHSLGGGFAYLLVYAACAYVFLSIYPDYITKYYSVQNLSGILWFGVPIEEYLFAVGFGLSWSPIYEYVKDIRGS